MGKVLRVTCEAGCDSQTTYLRLKGSESQHKLELMAQDEFSNWASYGFEVIDEKDVPEDEDVCE